MLIIFSIKIAKINYGNIINSFAWYKNLMKKPKKSIKIKVKNSSINKLNKIPKYI